MLGRLHRGCSPDLQWHRLQIVSNYIVFNHAHFLNCSVLSQEEISFLLVTYHFLKDSICCNSLSIPMSPELSYFSGWSLGFTVYIFDLLYHFFQHSYYVCFLCHLSGGLSSLCYSSSSKYNCCMCLISFSCSYIGFFSSSFHYLRILVYSTSPIFKQQLSSSFISYSFQGLFCLTTLHEYHIYYISQC